MDSDVRDALESLIRTYRTLQSGLYYETRPTNLIAAGLHQQMQEAVEGLRKELAEKNAMPIRDAEILGTLVFLERVELHENNGRPRGRAFIDYLRAYFPQNRAKSRAFDTSHTGMTGFIVFAHGSRVESANQAVRDVVSKIAAAPLAAGGQHVVEAAFLELGQPDLTGATGLLIARGAKRIVIIPYFLTLGTHMQRDLPRLARDASRAHGDIEMQITSPLDGHPALVQALLDRAGRGVVAGPSMRATLLEVHDIAPEVRHFVFEVPGVQQLHFKPGQFVSLNESINGKKITRAYSIVSLPSGNRFELCLNLVHEGAFTPHLFAHAARRLH